MRWKLKELFGTRQTYYATVGQRRLWENKRYGICFVDVVLRDGRYVAHHVWMDAGPFKEFVQGDIVRFKASVTSYVKWKAGKEFVDYTLRRPTRIKKADGYPDVEPDDNV